MTDLSINMGSMDPLLELDAAYMYANPEHYVDTTTSSESTSPIMSTFGMAVVPDRNVIANIYPSPTNSSRETASPQPMIKEEKPETPAPRPAAKRKRENRYKNAPPSVLSRRRAQNRASQRAYRERKDQRIKDLEQLLAESKQKNDAISEAYAVLQAEFIKLRTAQPRAHRHASISIPFDAQAMGVGGTAMNMVDGWHVYQDMSYSL